MKKNFTKVMVKSAVTTAMIAMVFISSGSESRACEYCGDARVDAYAASRGLTCKDILNNSALFEEYANFVLESEGGVEAFLSSLEVEPVFYTREDMLDLVNADRLANGRTALVWDEELAEYANERILEVYLNYHSEEFAAVYAAGGDRAAVAHRGIREGTGENALLAVATEYPAVSANNSWIESSTHHATRLANGITKYAAACYTDELTGDTVWIELFEDGNSRSFDYMRYAAENPDLAAAFGQDRNALYNHFVTCGANEGRVAYYTDGTAIGR